MFKKLIDFFVLPYWMLIEIIYGLRLGIIITLFLAVVFGSFHFEYKVIFYILLTVILGAIFAVFGSSYYYLKTKSIILDNEINILESEVELMPDLKSFGSKEEENLAQEGDFKKTDYSFILSLLRSLAFLFGSIPIFSPYLFNVSKILLVKIIIVFSFIFLCIIGIVEGKVRGESYIKNIFKEIALGIILVFFAYFWSNYIISIVKS